jgi:superfamily II DNA or RNA helicase
MPTLPLDHAVALKPWFTKNILEQGLHLLQNNEIHFFSFQRRYAGLLTTASIHSTLQMAEGRGKHRFVFRDGTCSQCIGRQGGTRCKHVAALAMLCLQECNNRLEPLADLFPDSPWAILGNYLHERDSMAGIRLKLLKKNNQWCLEGQDSSDLRLQVYLSGKAASEFACLFKINRQDRPETEITDSECGEMSSLREQLTRYSASPNEHFLNQNGSRSKQQHLDTSLWMHLARMFFLHFPSDNLKIRQDKQGIYHLYFSVNRIIIFKLSIPRLHTWELLDKLTMLDFPVTPEQAEQFSRVSFSTNGAEIEIVHCCRLPGGEEYRLSELESKRYGTRYQVDGHLFSLEPVPPEERLTRKQKGQLSLFTDPGGNNSEDHTGFVVKGEDISKFIREHHERLSLNRHQVAAEILDLHIVDMPAELVIDQYEEDGDWCYLAGWYDLGNRKIRLTELLSATAEGKEMLPGSTWLRLSGSPLSWFHRLGTDRIESGTGTGKGRIKMRRGEFMALSGQIGRIHNNRSTDSGTLPAFFQQSNTPDTLPLPEMPSHLRSYQRHGAAWLHQLHQYRLGGILADDMGLGKTHQALALLALLGQTDTNYLIVCPAAVLYHWPEKQEQFFPELSLSVYHGPKRNLDNALESQVIVTTYGILHRDADMLARHSFKLILFDEMHFLKNKKTAAYAAVSQLQANGIIGLTGTPVENKIGELATLLSLCLPDLFAVKQFRDQFKLTDTTEQRRKLQQLIAPFILRRTRKQVLKDLPECSEDIRLCILSPDQVAAYRQAIDQVKGAVDQLADGEVLSDFSHVLTTIIRLKQICNHLCQLEKCRDWNRYASGKWDEFTRLIHQCMEAGLKVVVFSQFTTMLDIIEAWLRAEQIGYVQLRGSVEAGKRSKRIKTFNTGKQCRVCCASLLAGGTGIDLTGAQVVIHYDRWWNPAKEEQATARVHRMGQRHPVQVYKLMTTGTLEEKIHRLIEKKRALAAELIVEDDGSILKTLSRRELAGLFQFSG